MVHSSAQLWDKTADDSNASNFNIFWVCQMSMCNRLAIFLENLTPYITMVFWPSMFISSYSLYEGWEYFKEMLHACLYNEIPMWILVGIFYNSLVNSPHTTIGSTSSGNLMGKSTQNHLGSPKTTSCSANFSGSNFNY